MKAYYNENDPYPAQWLRNLIEAVHIPPGDVDERDIREVQPDDLEGYGPCHFFAGIGGWACALRLAGIPDDDPVWTGSCPCQPLSSAGQRKGHADERHLWPAFHALIAERRPATVFGEQVASRDGYEWLAAVRADLEDSGYTLGAADLPAACVGAPHSRQRLFWCADLYCCQHFGSRPEFENLSIAKRAAPQAFEIANIGLSQLVAMGFTQRLLTYTDARRLVDGIPACMEQVRAYGNAIVPQVAAEFVTAAMESM